MLRGPTAVGRDDALGRDQAGHVVGLAGMRQEPPVVSQMPQVTRFAATDAPAPPLEKPGERSVSYGVHAAPPQVARALSVEGKKNFVAAAARSLVLPTWLAIDLAK